MLVRFVILRIFAIIQMKTKRGNMRTFRTFFLLSLLLLVAPLSATVEPALNEGSVSAAPEDKVVSGNVVDVQGDPLIGVTVQQKGTQQKTVTNIDGRYQLRCVGQLPVTLVYSYIGMKSQSVVVRGTSAPTVTLQEDATSIKDVVIVGAYGTTQKRSDLVGSAYQVTSADLKSLPQQRLDRMLEGIIPGLTVDVNSDTPGSARPRYNTRIRGEASMSASNEPLWVVDGMPMYTGGATNQMPGQNYTISPLSLINPDDIESITVLKDATATTIYGADGANGVILITTKKGRAGRTNVNVNVQYGIAKLDMSTAPKMLTSEQYLALAHEAWTNSGQREDLFPFQDNELNSYSTTETDWYDEFYQTGNTFQGNVSMNGGSDRSNYYLSGSYYENSPIIKGTKQQRFTLRSNTDFRIGKYVKAGANLSASYNINDLFNLGREVYNNLPILSPYNEDGSFRLYNREVVADDQGNPTYRDYKFLDNSVAEREQNTNQQRALVVNANFMLGVDILEGLSYTGRFGIDFQSNLEEMYNSSKNWTGMSTSNGEIVRNAYSSRYSSHISKWTTNHRLNFNRTFGKHTVGALGVFECGSLDYTTVQAWGYGFFNDNIRDVSYANSTDGRNNSTTEHSMSLVGQLSYSYDHRYYLTVNGRRDGKSQFGSDVRWAPFASVGVSWNIHNEKFLKIPEWLTVLKLRATYGTNGNSRLGSQQALGLYAYGDSYSYNGEIGGQQSGSPNPSLSWEKTYATNLALRVEVLKRFDVEVEYYNNHTKNLLSKLDVSRTTGDLRVYRNVGEIRNRGFEVTVETKNFVPKTDGGFSWTTLLNLAHNRNKLLKLYNGIQKNFTTTTYKEGYDTHTYFLVRWAGVDPADGMPMWYDKNGNITKTFNYADRVADKNSNPDVFGGMTNTLGYKNFTLRFQLNYQFGGYAFGGIFHEINSDGRYIADANQGIEQLDHWRQPGDVTANPKPLWNVSTGSVMSSTRSLLNKTLITMKNLVLGYEVPRDLLQPYGVRSCNVSFVADNLFIYSPYSGKNKNSYKTCMSGYPSERQFSLAVSLGF